jgi:hypothetical protein
LLPERFRDVIRWLLLVDMLLLAAGVALRPASVAGAAGITGLIGPAIIFIAYWFVPRSPFWQSTPDTLHVGNVSLRFGLAAGEVFSAEILLEYLILPDGPMNTRLGFVEFGSVFAIFAIAAFSVAWRTRLIRAAIRAAVGAAMVSSLIWLTTLWLATFTFWGTTRQNRVFSAEGDYEDYARSGMNDFASFTLQDLRGATFFHLLLVPLLALIIGFAVAAVAKGLRRRGRMNPSRVC